MAKRTSIRARLPELRATPHARFYSAPEIQPRGSRARHERLLPNDICPCGSGLKVKKCHPAASRSELAALGTAATLEHALAAARPLFLDPDVPGYPLIRAGTCWLFAYRGDMWLVSTQHAFRKRELTPDRARVFVSIQSGKAPAALALAGEYVEPLDQDPEDTAWRDFVLIRCAALPPAWMHLLDLDRAGVADLRGASEEDWLRVFGFADAMGNEVSYEDARITIAACTFDGRYAGPTESKFVHAIRFDSTGHIEDFNGMSGGPVFFTKRASEPWEYAGILITSSEPAGLARFVDATKVVDTLSWHYDVNPEATVDPRKRR